jgi:hypothetical protein
MTVIGKMKKRVKATKFDSPLMRIILTRLLKLNAASTSIHQLDERAYFDDQKLLDVLTRLSEISESMSRL